MISRELATIIILVLFSLGTILGLGGVLSRKTGLQKAGCTAFALALLIQTVTLFFGFHKSFAGGLSSGAYLQMMAWFIGLAGTGVSLRLKQTTAVIFAAPFCTVLFAVSLLCLEHVIHVPEQLRSSFYILHIASLYLSLACIAIAFIVSTLFLFLEHRIKRKQSVHGFLMDMPALSVLDTINGCCILAAFPTYTVGIISGLLNAQPVFGATFSGDPKEIVSLLILALLALVFHNRLASSWTGRKPALTMICIFGLSLFSLLIVNTVMDSHHAFLNH